MLNSFKNYLLRNVFLLNLYDDYRAKREASWYTPSFVPKNILDLGAHKGYVTEALARTYPLATIHAYEPNPRLFTKLLRRTKKYPNVVCFNEAISGERGAMTFYVSPRDVSSSLTPLPDSETVSVPCVTLKDAVSRLDGEVFVKMDIEGAEYDVLKHIPTQIREIYGEAHPTKAGRDNQELKESLACFKHVSIKEGKALFHAF